MTDEQRARELAERVQLLVLCGGDCMTHVTALLLPLIRDQRRLTEASARMNRRTEISDPVESFRDAVIDALINIHSYTTEHDTDPRKAIADLIEIETNIALDPAVSSDARALINRGRKEAEQENARLREAIYLEIEEMARNWNDAPDVVRSALVIVARRVREESAPPSSPSGS